MTRFAILLGGELTVTQRLRDQAAGARIIAADSGMMHAASLGVVPELWVGDFDSAGSELAIDYADVPRQTFPAAKDATDGAIAVAEAQRRGAREILLLGALGGQTDHTMGLVCQGIALAKGGIGCMLSSGIEEAWPLIPGTLALDLPAGTRLSVIALSDLEGLELAGVTWPLTGQTVELGSTLTLSNAALGPVRIGLRTGHGAVITYPPLGAHE